jgi:hypothetical protein
MSETRLILVGDDDALDTLAELARYLPVFEVMRIGELPERALDGDDVVVIGVHEPRARDALLREAMSRGAPRHVAFVQAPRDEEGRDSGARGILVAAELVRVLFPETGG